MALSIEEKYDEVRQLITMGKEKGYLLYEEVNDMLPSEISSSDELDDIFSMFGQMGIEVVDSEQKFREAKEGEEATAKVDEAGEKKDGAAHKRRRAKKPEGEAPAAEGAPAAVADEGDPLDVPASPQ